MVNISIAYARSRFSELISRTIAGERFVIQRRERPVAVLLSTADLERLERASQAAHRLALALGQEEELLAQIERNEAHPAMAAFGLWRDIPDLASLAEEEALERMDSPHRTEIIL